MDGLTTLKWLKRLRLTVKLPRLLEKAGIAGAV